MGEVYLARDVRLSREVAIKVLPKELAADPERLARFERETRAASALHHPSIVTVYDVGRENDVSYLVMERIDGETLRQRMAAGPIPPRQLLPLAASIAEGLASAHEAGVVHRDFKPENVMISREGHPKILDFGLARISRTDGENLSVAETAGGVATAPGVVLGTVSYMAPEQASGREVDFRCDQFAFGAVLYEMAAGNRPFGGSSAIETLSAILRDEPPPLASASPSTPPPLRWIIERCIAKSPDQRYASTRDLARDLRGLSDHLSEASGLAAPIAAAAAPARPRAIRLAAVAAGILVALALTFYAGKRTVEGPSPTFQQLTFRRGTIVSARFAPDGQTIVYGAAWGGRPFKVFTTRPESAESRLLDLPDADILAISPSGEMALSLGRHFYRTFDTTGTLAQAALAGGAPRPVLEDVQWADWSSDGKDLAVVRQAGGKSRLEFPIGKQLYETTGWISHPRVSPRGDLVAFLNHPDFVDPRSAVAVVDRAGKLQSLTPVATYSAGLAWRPDGGEVWYTASSGGINRSIEAVTLSGRRRTVLRAPGVLTIHDIARDGRVLLARDSDRMGLMALPPAAGSERDVTWFNHSSVRDISQDGRSVLFFEGSIGGQNAPIYLGRTDGSAPVRIGEGYPTSLSPDGAWALAVVRDLNKPAQIRGYPTGPGQPKTLTDDAINHSWANWLPDGKSILFAGTEPGHGTRLYIQDLQGGPPRAITVEGVSLQWHGVSPDGHAVAALGPDRKPAIYPVDGGSPRPIPGIQVADEPIRWSAEGSSLFVYQRGSLPARVEKVDVSTGARGLWKELSPPDLDGVTNLVRIRITPDGSSYAYTYFRLLSELFLVDGLR